VGGGATPLHLAVLNDDLKTVNVLLEHGADVYATTVRTRIHAAERAERMCACM
jgi:ankyrin repeat protein